MTAHYRFDRMEWAGSLGDLGTLLPLALGMILINGLNPLGVFLTIGIYYVASGIYFGVTVPVQPMKVVGAYAVAMALTPSQIAASGLLIGCALFVIGATGIISWIGRHIPHAVVRGVQLSTGTLLMAEGVKLIMGTTTFQAIKQAAEPYLSIQQVGPLPIGIILGIVGGIATLLLLESRTIPAGLAVVLGGITVGLIMGTHEGLGAVKIGVNLPALLPFGWPAIADYPFALFVLVLPQIPMTIGNAIVAYADLSRDYFGDASQRVTYRATCISMALANIVAFFFGGMPLCHGAGGLAAHYRFGARTPGSNLIIGCFFVLLAILFGTHSMVILNLIPLAILGVLLLFAGSQLALTILDINDRKRLFVVLTMLGITLASNLAIGFTVGIGIAYALKSDRLHV